MLRRSNKIPAKVTPMIARWDVLLVAAVIAGASMMIESSHRVDTGLADDAMAAPACTDAIAARADASPSDDASDARYAISAADDDALPTCE